MAVVVNNGVAICPVRDMMLVEIRILPQPKSR